ncbi:hypothetical protein HS141_15020, partial [Cetobacterium somerae]|uniref:DUF6923 family protein n=2 Tax=Cetobacterium somerae TaxID=188913 RepID=UPI00211ED70A
MKLKYKSCIKSFILFILFNILSAITFSNAINSKSQNNIDVPAPIEKQSRRASVVNPFNSGVDQERGYLIQDLYANNQRKLRITPISLSSGKELPYQDLLIGGSTSNAFGYNPTNDYIYGIHTAGSPTKTYLIKVGRSTNDSGKFDFTQTEMSNIGYMYIADFDTAGNFYVSDGSVIYKVNVGTGATSSAGSVTSSFADWGHTDAVGGQERFYFVTDSWQLGYYYKDANGNLVEELTNQNVKPKNGSRTTRIVGVFMDGTDMYIYPSSETKVYKIDLTNTSSKATDIGATISVSNLSGDAARKYTSKVTKLAVIKSVDKGEAKPGDTITYTLKIGNTSPSVTLTSIEIKDILDQNISEAFSEFKIYDGTDLISESVPNDPEIDIRAIASLEASKEKIYTIVAKIKEDYAGDLIKNKFTAETGQLSETSNWVETRILKLAVEKTAKYDDKEIPTDKVFQPGDKIRYTIVLNGNLADVAYGNYQLYDNLIEGNKVNGTTYIGLDDITIISGLAAEKKSELFKSPGTEVDIPANGLIIVYELVIPDLPEGTTEITNVVAGKEVIIKVDEPEVVVSKTALSGESSVSGKTFQPGDKIDYTITLTNPTNAVYKDYVVYDELLKNNLIASKDVTEPTVTGYDLFTENTAKVTVEPGKPITIKYTLTIPDLTTLPEGTTLPATISNVVADQKVDIVVD